MSRSLEARLARLEHLQKPSPETDEQYWFRRFGLRMERVREICAIIVKAEPPYTPPGDFSPNEMECWALIATALDTDEV